MKTDTNSNAMTSDRPAGKGKGKGKVRVAALVMTALTFTGIGIATTTSPAGAAMYGGSMSCSHAWGIGTGAPSPGDLIIGLASAPEGTTDAVYLYRSVWTGTAWSAWQYQGYQAARANNNYGWSQPALFGQFDFPVSSTPSYYSINMRTWNRYGQLIENVYSNSALYC